MRESLAKQDFLLPKEAAEILRVDVYTLWKYARNSETNGMPVMRIGKSIKIPRQRFLKWAGLAGDQ